MTLGTIFYAPLRVFRALRRDHREFREQAAERRAAGLCECCGEVPVPKGTHECGACQGANWAP
ncbi:MAG: hypothetical protein JWN66_4981 [Sphingomonas bacterium]|nr:hypothetical protein [Sphingomonas bacterium]